jgi:hypothetical protein
LQQRIVGVIDHHALQSETIVTELPIFIDIRPWGSMSTIVTHGYLTAGRKPPPPIAGGDRCLGCRSRFGWLLVRRLRCLFINRAFTITLEFLVLTQSKAMRTACPYRG